MGLITSSKLLVRSLLGTSSVVLLIGVQTLVPGLIESIKAGNLVLVSDVSDSETNPQSTGMPFSSFYGVPDNVDGVLRKNGIMRFRESIDM